MSFIDRMIGSDERIIARTNPHWIYIIQGLICLVLILLSAHMLDQEIKSYIRQEILNRRETDMLVMLYNYRAYLFWSLMVFGISVFLYHLVFYRSTHIAVTSDRLIYKTGMFFVDVHETSLDEIKSEQVHNGFFGKFFDYGFVEVDCRFVKNMNLPAINRPYAFLHDLHKLIKKMPPATLEKTIDSQAVK